jgi:hypothetical protein
MRANRKKWWSDRRYKYNVGLVLAGIVAFIFYVIVGASLIMPYDEQFEITLFTTAFQGIGYLFMMFIANLFYDLGYWVDKIYNRNNSEAFRQRLFNIGFWFSCALPFLIPISLIIQYFIEFHK